MNTKLLLVCFLLGVGVVEHFAQNFEPYYEQAANNHPSLKAVFNEYYALLEQKKQVGKLPAPELAFGIFILPVETRLGAQRAKVGLKQFFPPVGQLKARVKLVNQQAVAKMQEASIQRNELYFNLQRNWYQLLQIKTLLQVLEQQRKRLNTFEALALQQIQLAKGSTADVYRIRLRYNDLTHQMALLENDYPAYLLAFQILMNSEDSVVLNLPDSIPLRILNYPADSLKAWIFDQNPQLQLLTLKEAALQQKKQWKATQNRPAFGVGLDYVLVTERTDANPIGNGRDILMPMGSIKVPIYAKQNKARLKEVDFELLALAHKKEALQDQLLVYLEQALTNYRAAQLDQKFYEEQIAFTQKTLEVLIGQFSIDANSFDKVLETENKLFKYEQQLINSQIKQNIAVARVEQLFAQPLN